MKRTGGATAPGDNHVAAPASAKQPQTPVTLQTKAHATSTCNVKPNVSTDTTSMYSPSNISKIKQERAARAAEGPGDSKQNEDVEEPDDNEPSAADAEPIEHKPSVTIKLKTAADERADRVWFNAAEEGRRQAGEVTLLGLVRSVDEEQPGLEEAQRRLGGVLVKYSVSENKRPSLKVMKNPVLNLDAFYVLPPKLLKACLKLLSITNTANKPVELDGGQPPIASGPTEVVQIKDIGSFTRQQVETFQRVATLKNQVTLGLDLHKWFLQEALPALPAELHVIAEDTARDILANFPAAKIVGLPQLPEYCYAMLYRATPPTWLTDACICALCHQLVSAYPAARYGGFQTRTPGAKPKDVKMDKDILLRVSAQVREIGVDVVLIPVNFDNAHWSCMVIQVSTKRIYCYDPLNASDYTKTVLAYGASLKTSLENIGLWIGEFDVVALNTLIRFDLYSCGVFVRWTFIRHVVPFAQRDMSNGASLTRRRFELSYLVLTRKLLESATIGKQMPVVPIPASSDSRGSEDEQQCTQPSERVEVELSQPETADVAQDALLESADTDMESDSAQLVNADAHMQSGDFHQSMDSKTADDERMNSVQATEEANTELQQDSGTGQEAS